MAREQVQHPLPEPAPAGGGRAGPRVGRRSGLIDDPAVELAFRRAALPAEMRQATLTLLAAGGLIMAFGLNDWRVSRGTPAFQALAIIRGAALAATVLTLAVVRIVRDPGSIDRWMSRYLVGLAVAVVALSAIRPATSPIPHLINGLALMALLGTYPGPTRRALPGALTLALGGLALFVFKGLPPDPLAPVAIPVVLVGGGVTGWLLSRSVQLSRRELYLAFEEQRAMNEALRSAQAELRTLQGIIPICGHCKKIRNDAGYWQQLEHYLSEHSDASFSHGICPDCVRDHWPDESPELESGVRP